MADFTSQFTFAEEARAGFGRMLASVGRSFENYAHARSRTHLIAALDAKTDEELAALGLKRDEIVRHVFRDLFYI